MATPVGWSRHDRALRDRIPCLLFTLHRSTNVLPRQAPHGGVLSLHSECGPSCVSGPCARPASLYSVKRWRRPRSSARSRRAIMCSALERPMPSFQRHTVWRLVPRRREISDHDRPDSSLNRSSRCGNSSGKSWVFLLYCVRCRGIARILATDGRKPLRDGDAQAVSRAVRDQSRSPAAPKLRLIRTGRGR